MNSFEFLEDLFEPVLVADQNREIIYYNASFLTLFKTTPRLMKKQSDFKEFLTSLIPQFENFFEDLMKDNQAISRELNCMIELVDYTLIIKGVKKDSGLTILFFKDVTVEKNLNDKYRAQLEELKSTHAQIVQSDKLKVIGEMTASISHEINNPLTVAIGNSELIGFTLEKPNLNEQKANLLKFQGNISHSLERMNKIISNMKEFTHKSEDKKEYCDAKEVIDQAIAFINPSLKKTSIKVNVSQVGTGPAPILLINRIKIEQVFVNLIQNAIDSLREAETVDPLITIELESESNGNFIQMRIKDNGPGILSENKTKIFESFFTTKEIGKGSGLGLAISHRIIQSHLGELELIDSEIGAYFKITLPAIGMAGHVSGNWEKLITDSDKIIKVLVVDNELNILNLCMNFLSDSDYFFLGASSAIEAYKELERVKVDIIITDVKMPLIDGEHFVRGLREQNNHIPVLFMTSKDFVVKYKKMKDELKINGIIIKPFTKDELLGAIGAVLND
jgi:signal transduction histidine kinase/CheY-like chemotaxis protein